MQARRVMRRGHWRDKMRFLKQAALLFLAAALLLCTLSGCGGALKLQAVADPAEDYFRDRPYALEAGQTRKRARCPLTF